MSAEKYILYGILNWGLGHATRSVPVIKDLVKEGFTPVLCSDGIALEYLRREFPELPIENLPPYHMRYNRFGVMTAVMMRLPSLYRAIKAEHQAVKTLRKKYEPHGLISDNRLGFYHKKLPSAYLTHQLDMALPFFLSPANSIHNSYIRKHTQCWIPDFPDNYLAGKLSNGKYSPVPVKYMGPLSRFRGIENSKLKKEYDAVAILSGPEPQRSLVEDKLISGFERMQGKFAIIRGVAQNPVFSDKVEIHGLLQEKEVSKMLRSAEVVISRSGYSSLMDYYFIGNKALLIPTPGQPEQEYLARYHCSMGHFQCRGQRNINLVEDLKRAANSPGMKPSEIKLPAPAELFSLFEGKRKGGS